MESIEDFNERVKIHLDKVEQGITVTNSQSGVAKEFDIQEKNRMIADIIIKAVKSLDNIKHYKRKTPRKLVSIYNKRKPNYSRSLPIYRFAITHAMTLNQIRIIQSQPIAPRNFTKGGVVISNSEDEFYSPKSILK